MEVSFLDAFTVVALRVGQTEQSLLDKRILLVPEGEGYVLEAMGVTNTGNTVLAPSVGTGPSMVVREVAPGITISTVVLSYGSPLPLSNIRTPLLPVLGTIAVFLQTLLLLGEVFVAVKDNHVCGWFVVGDLAVVGVTRAVEEEQREDRPRCLQWGREYVGKRTGIGRCTRRKTRIFRNERQAEEQQIELVRYRWRLNSGIISLLPVPREIWETVRG
jgi:hypothetical protein